MYRANSNSDFQFNHQTEECEAMHCDVIREPPMVEIPPPNLVVCMCVCVVVAVVVRYRCVPSETT